MQVKQKTGTITEPVSITEAKNYIGYTSTDQDDLFTTLVTAAREWVEYHFGISAVEKSYIVRFDKYDTMDGWYELPVFPVTAITAVSIDGEEIEYEERGDETRFILPDEVLYTGVSSNELVVEFVAGAANSRVKMGIMRVVSDMFNNKDDNPTNINTAKLSFNTMHYLEGLNQNTGL